MPLTFIVIRNWELVGEGGDGSYQQLAAEGEEGGEGGEISTLCLQMHKQSLSIDDEEDEKEE